METKATHKYIYIYFLAFTLKALRIKSNGTLTKFLKTKLQSENTKFIKCGDQRQK